MSWFIYEIKDRRQGRGSKSRSEGNTATKRSPESEALAGLGIREVQSLDRSPGPVMHGPSDAWPLRKGHHTTHRPPPTYPSPRPQSSHVLLI